MNTKELHIELRTVLGQIYVEISTNPNYRGKEYVINDIKYLGNIVNRHLEMLNSYK